MLLLLFMSTWLRIFKVSIVIELRNSSAFSDFFLDLLASLVFSTEFHQFLNRTCNPGYWCRMWVLVISFSLSSMIFRLLIRRFRFFCEHITSISLLRLEYVQSLHNFLKSLKLHTFRKKINKKKLYIIHYNFFPNLPLILNKLSVINKLSDNLWSYGNFS